MKTALIILVIVAIIAVLNGVVCGFISDSTAKMTPYIDSAEEAVKAGDIDKAAAQVKELRQEWDDSQPLWEAFVDHREAENVETLLTRLEGMINSNTPELLLPELEELEFFFTHLKDKQQFKLENIF